MPRIKICCIASVEEAELAIRCGASAIGLVSEMPSGPGVIPDDAITEIAARVPPGVDSFLLTCAQDPKTIIEQQRRAGVPVVQLCDSLPSPAYAVLRRAMPGVRLVQVIHVTGPESVSEALAAAPHVHALLLDSGRPGLAVKELGGTGRVHDWSVSREIRDCCHVPLYLAGGLRPDNVADAVNQVEPFGLDVCTGVRTDGRLDAVKLRAFVEAAHGRPN
ncbi:MAG: phosphoribosylanthranilate isomerase [Actinomycetota bacterium]